MAVIVVVKVGGIRVTLGGPLVFAIYNSQDHIAKVDVYINAISRIFNFTHKKIRLL